MFRTEACWITVAFVALTSGPLRAQMNWVPDAGNPIGSPFTFNQVPGVLWDEEDEVWRLWYYARDFNWSIAYAESENGSLLDPPVPDVVFPARAGAVWDNCGYWAPSIIYDPEHPSTVVDEGGQPYAYQMWYTGSCGYDGCGPCPPGNPRDQIGYVVSHDGRTWVRPPEVQGPVLSTAGWDSQGMHIPNVLYDADDGLYKMWYTALNVGGHIGFATSRNGYEWQKRSRPLELRRPGEGSTINCMVSHNGTHYEMWFTVGVPGPPWSIHYARSLDGEVWTRPPDSLVNIPSGGSWDDDGVCNPTVHFNGAEYRTWYTGDCRGNLGDSWRTGTATFEPELPRPHFQVTSEGDPVDGLEITFDARISNSPVVPNPQPGDFSYAWDFGDGETGEGVTVKHDYEHPGDYRVRLTFSDGFESADIERILTVGFRSEPVPGWTSVDIGEPFGPGGARPEGDCFRVLGAAGNIRGHTDRFQFLHREITGDFRFTATVADWESERAGSKFGLMVREGTGAGARNVFLDVLTSVGGAEGRLRFQRRLSEDGTTATESVDGLEGRGPVHLRIERCGDEITASVSGDGVTWNEPMAATLEGLGGEVLVGIAASSYSVGSTRDWCIATVCDLSIETLKNCGPEPGFRRGDTNDDGAVNIADAQYLLNFLFLGGPKPACDEATNVNDDGQTNIADAQYLLNFLFLGGPKPNAPYPDCGVDPQGEILGCESSACE